MTMPPTASDHLSALARLHHLLKTDGIDYCVFGGWAGEL